MNHRLPAPIRRSARTAALTLSLALVLASSVAAQRPEASTTPKRPNVLLILVDDLNDWIGCLGGHAQAVTPNIDALARRGLLFRNAHCQAPICNPSRVSFMTGRLPSSTGVYLLRPHRFRVSKALAKARTLPEYFTGHGYETLGCGKIYHASSSRETFGEYGPRAGFGPRPKQKINHKQGHVLWDWGAFPERDSQMPDVKVANWAIGKLGVRRQRPFLLAVGFARPHVPMYVPQKWFDGLPEEAEIELPEVLARDRLDLSDYARKLTHGGVAPRHRWFLENQQWRRAVRSYLACIRFVDHQVGRVLRALEASEFADNTIVVLASDHGFHLGEKERWAKRSLWRESTRVPLIVTAPGHVRARDTDQPVGLIDIYPTLVDLCGLPPNPKLEGHSLRPLLRDPAAEWNHVAITTFYTNNHSVVTRGWRYIRYADGSQELYDHRVDPREFHNLATESGHADRIKALAAHLPTTNVAPVPGSAGSGSLLEGVK